MFPCCSLLQTQVLAENSSLIPHRTMERRRRARPTDLADRVLIVQLWMDGMSNRVIARATGCSVTTVWRWIKRWKREGNVNTKYCYVKTLKQKRLATHKREQTCPPITWQDASFHVQTFRENFIIPEIYDILPSFIDVWREFENNYDFRSTSQQIESMKDYGTTGRIGLSHILSKYVKVMYFSS
ncbi:putative Glutamate receptor-like 76 [Homarus americanus]|uniref:Putative Glutamate receptor-like 76 n=1 Tax=Homarus americanus TaxID=6706 RepID=A0A8J5JW98_HOMAM|nr:putative Glutamate receptor-like 76 [Homarus americanus]